MPRNLTNELSPAQDVVQIGIELEGVGQVSMKWPQELGHQTVKTFSQLRTQTDFPDSLKRTALLRSPSFDNLRHKGHRGVSITPEDTSKLQLGKSHPAELVSHPHILDEANLNALRSSVHKALQSNLSGKESLSTGAANQRYGTAPTAPITFPKVGTMAIEQSARPFSGISNTQTPLELTIESTHWTRKVPATIGGNLQITCGIAVEQLFRRDLEQLKDMAQFLSRDPCKARFITLVLASTAIVDALCSEGEVFFAFAGKRVGLQLMVFMFLLHHMAKKWKGAYEKEALGANFKGCSSFVGCGVSDTNDNIPVDSYANTYQRLTRALDESSGELRHEVMQCLPSADVIEKLGKPGLSMQVHYDKWHAIPNFMDANGNLYTVVEIRQRNTGMNLDMGGFLTGRLTARALLDRITPYVFAPA
jgi:hypothetical protein